MNKRESYKLASRDNSKKQTKIKINDVIIGGEKFVIMAGPCSVESREQIQRLAKLLGKINIKIIRGGAFKPRTSPYSFQGLEGDGLKYLREAADKYNLLVVSEIMDSKYIDLFLEYVDIIQVGARNMQNFSLLKELSKIKKPILLKRGMGATIEELLSAAEYILQGGNWQVILCERGIRTFETSTRFTLDISAIPVLKKLTHLPVIIDPSHAAGNRDIIPALSKAAFVAGADGLLIEVHDDPKNALSDGAQALLPRELNNLIKDLKNISAVIKRPL